MATASVAELTAKKISQTMVVTEITQTKLADLTGISRSTLRRKLADGEPFNVSEVYRIAKALGVAPSSLLPDELTKTPTLAA